MSPYKSMLIVAALLMGGSAALRAEGLTSPPLSIWFDAPAGTEWTRALPLGNGRLGAMVFGGIDTERVMFNEDSLWSGWPVPDANREGSAAALEKARALIREKKIKEASDLLLNDFCSLYGYGKPDFGAYQAFFDAWIDTGLAPADAKDYRRELDLKTAVASVRYRKGAVNYEREYFCSHPAEATVMRFAADRAGSVSVALRVTSPHKGVRVEARDNELVLSGHVDTGSAEHPGITFEGRLLVRAQGGTVTADGRAIRVEHANEVVIIMVGATDYRLAYPDYRGAPPGTRNQAVLERIRDVPYAELKQAHIADYRRLFDRVTLDLQGTARTELPTDRRLAAYKASRDDRGLEAVVFQYGRYLLIASSRPGGLPANLQGLWNNSNKPPWNCDYHLNINLQMNYWPADSANLSECFEPLARWVADLTKPGTKTAQVHYGTRGWVAHHTANVWGATVPGPRRGVHMLEAESAAFICQNVWDHYAFTRDRDYLAETAWPILKGAALFWVDNLQEVEGGHLAVSPSYSPEHGPLSDGAYYQTMIVWDLFTSCIEATEILEIDADLREQLRGLRARLQPPRVGPYGELCEWRDPELEKNANTDKHRHVSFMFAVYPGRQIVPDREPALTQAAIRSMDFRGDAATGWSMGWKINLWARLRDGDHAHKLIGNLLSGRLYPNLWDSCPPFQIDGNFGYTAGVVEMLLQSHAGVIHLLPALPAAWGDGEVAGLKARGNVTVDMRWKTGRLEAVTLRTPTAKRITVRYRDQTRDVDLAADTATPVSF